MSVVFHGMAVENQRFRRQEGSVLEQLSGVSEIQKKENREYLGDLIHCSYFHSENELPHTLLYNPLLQLISSPDYSDKLAEFFETYKRKNATCDSTTSIMELLEATNEIIKRNLLTKLSGWQLSLCVFLRIF